MENSLSYNSKLHPITYKLRLISQNLSTILENQNKISLLSKKLLFENYAFQDINFNNSEKAKTSFLKNKLFFKLEETVKENNEYFIYYKGKSKYYINFKGKYKIYLGKGRNKKIIIKYRILKNNLGLTSKNTNKDYQKNVQSNNIRNTSFKNKLLYYNKVNKLTKYNINKFIVSLHNNLSFIGLDTQKNNNIMLPSMKDVNLLNLASDNNIKINLNNLSKHVFKYKIYNNNIQYLNNEINSKLASHENNNESSLLHTSVNNYSYIKGCLMKKPNYTISKLKSMNKLFTLYNNLNLLSAYKQEREMDKNNANFSRKIILNTYKLLRKSYIKLQTENNPNNKVKNVGKASNLNVFNTLYMENDSLINNKGLEFKSQSPVTRKLANNSKSYITIKKTMQSVIILNKLNRIDRFFDKYKNLFLDSKNNNLNLETEKNNLENIEISNKNLSTVALNHKIIENSKGISLQIISLYKINLINELLEKELLYIYYLKLLSYNNAIFKNWFTYSLKNLISKIYNKKVIFNFINLKYIHLNSDILSQAVNIRLRNFKKNRVVKVLKKAIKVVPISKVNIYACDEHSSAYKYINNFYNKFFNLKLDIFKELNLIQTNNTDENSLSNNIGLASKDSVNNTYPSSVQSHKIRKLNLMQANTINFIKYKSVFGVRFEAAGRLTKRSTASRSLFKFRYNGTLRNNPSIILNNNLSSVRLKNNRISNLQFTKIASKTRNGSFGLKGWINNN